MTASGASLTGGTTPGVTIATVTAGVAYMDISGAIPLAANGRLALAGSVETPLLECADGGDLYIKLGSAASVDGFVSYTVEEA